MAKVYRQSPMGKVLILGRRPPPIGGITVHVSRLVENLECRDFHGFTFCDFGNKTAFGVILEIIKHKVIHLHVSRPWLQVIFAVFCQISGKRLILTYHGNWGRYNPFGNWLVGISAWLSEFAIVQNEESQKQAKRWKKKKTLLISTFLSAPMPAPLQGHIQERLENFIKNWDRVVCTNAWNLTFDKKGKETYGILELIEKVQTTSGIGLVVSDPSGQYNLFVKRTFGIIPSHVLLISEPHDFRNILLQADAFIRNTTTDGVSLSVHEAFELNVPVLASAAVARPAFCKVYNDLKDLDLHEAIGLARKLCKECNVQTMSAEPIKELMQLYDTLLGDKRWKCS
jgi:glycosyltransferase involved in cell wall biosynthesis